MDPNHDIVPTLRMFDGVMTGLAADEIERLRKRVAELEADARVGLTADMRDVLGGNFGALEQAEDLCRATGNDSSADGLNALSYALRALLQGANHA